MATYVIRPGVVGLDVTPDINIRCYYGLTGDVIWETKCGAPGVSVRLTAAACDQTNDFIYVTTSTGNIYKLNALTGAIITNWSRPLGSASLGAIGVFSNGDVCYGGAVASSRRLYRATASGSLVWDSNNLEGFVSGLAIDSNNAINISQVQNGVWNHNQLDQNAGGNWIGVNHGADMECVAVGPSNVVAFAGISTGGVSTRKYISTGTPLWNKDHTNTVSGIAIDSLDNTYTTGLRVGGNITTRKYDSSGTEVTAGWPLDFGADSYSISTDDTYVYVSGDRNDTINSTQATLRCYEADTGTLVWSKDWGPTTLTPEGGGTITLWDGPVIEQDPLVGLDLYERVGTHLFRTETWAKPQTLRFALLSSVDPVTEVTASGYARILLEPSNANWSAPVNGDGVFSNARSLQFRPMEVTLVGWALIDQMSETFLVVRTFSSPIVCTMDQAGPYFPIGSLQFQFS